MAAGVIWLAKLVARSDRIISFAGSSSPVASLRNRSAGWLNELPGHFLAFFVLVGGLGGIRRRILSLDSLRRL